MNLIGGAEYVQLKIRSTVVRRKPRLELKVDTPGWAVRMDEREHKRTNAVDNAADLRTKAWSDARSMYSQQNTSKSSRHL